MTRRRRVDALHAALGLSLLDLAAVVMTGGASLVGRVGETGFALRVVVALGLLLACHRRRRKRAPLYGYLAVLLLLASVLHFRGYRLRGDGLWYYAFAHSVAFDFDLDLGNQYRRLGIDDERGSQPVRETGRARFTFPVGAPLAWVPFIWLGHGAAWLANAHGMEAAYDGISDPYLHTVALANLLFGFLGLLVLHRLLRHWFADGVSFLATLGIALGTFLGWYLAYHAIYTHALTFLLVTWYLERWVQSPSTPRDYLVLGLILGAAVCVRWQNAVFGALVAWPLLTELRARRWRPAAAFASGLVLLVLPQLLSWKTIFDRFYVGVPLGADYMRWSDPFLTETLFASRHGLFSWSPLLLVAAFGLLAFVRRAPSVGLPLVGLLAVLTYVNSSVADWWAGGSFGARRFDSALPIFALGLASAFTWARNAVRRRPMAVVAAGLAVVVIANALLMEQLRKGRLPVDDTMSWQAAAEAGLEDWFDAVGYPFSFPMNWLFALSYDRPKTQYDILVGKYLFHRMHNLGGVIDLGVDDAAFIGNGWSGLRDGEGRPRELRYAEGARAGLFVPTDRPEPLLVVIECGAPPEGTPVPVEVWLNGARIGGLFPESGMTEHAFRTDAALWKRINFLELVPAAPTDGAPYLAVDRLRFERLTR